MMRFSEAMPKTDKALRQSLLFVTKAMLGKRQVVWGSGALPTFIKGLGPSSCRGAGEGGVRAVGTVCLRSARGADLKRAIVVRSWLGIAPVHLPIAVGCPPTLGRAAPTIQQTCGLSMAVGWARGRSTGGRSRPPGEPGSSAGGGGLIWGLFGVPLRTSGAASGVSAHQTATVCERGSPWRWTVVSIGTRGLVDLSGAPS